MRNSFTDDWWLNRQLQYSSLSGEYSRLVSYFLFKRNIGFYIIQIYLPSVLIVVISWVSFWLSRDATPARVALGVTTVLTMTTLMTTTNSAMPKVSYVKSIDIFLGFPTDFGKGICSQFTPAEHCHYSSLFLRNHSIRLPE
ncbi:Neurotransmitter-gated ion-channel transmembrane region [Ancylostoma ceylanicum]|uniref:Neurotransmitter-gated ion-channel transmembrane region n=1 Tax=Ancylostoma ceylanicum TaxID=53326 RepID=A0A0D6LZQ6_9BILA|nr:Neurotransmitter-gated ion-channel transmembrane region [Ancylostoma ceylanicum]